MVEKYINSVSFEHLLWRHFLWAISNRFFHQFSSQWEIIICFTRCSYSACFRVFAVATFTIINIFQMKNCMKKNQFFLAMSYRVRKGSYQFNKFIISLHRMELHFGTAPKEFHKSHLISNILKLALEFYRNLLMRIENIPKLWV